jgi:hypothetical protein
MLSASLGLESFDDVVEGDDDATLSQSISVILSSTQYVVYSVTFQVPALYFTIQNSSACACIMRLTRAED